VTTAVKIKLSRDGLTVILENTASAVSWRIGLLPPAEAAWWMLKTALLLSDNHSILLTSF